ncbi:MAG: PAS domain-containing protein [Anaerolineaceae bacterium]
MTESRNINSTSDEKTEKQLPLQVGAMTLEQITLLFTHLPVDVTFVDDGNDVRFYSGGKNRVFERTPDIIGRNVLNCHHPDSVQTVMKILEDFRAGTRDTAEFWIQTKPQDPQNRFIHIQYFAVRDTHGKFYGTLEVTQDVTEIRKLQGERRLLDEEK